VERVPHPEDRRTTLAAITPAGRDVAEAATEALNQSRFGTGRLPKSDLEAMTSVLTEVRRDAGDFD
jgi:DNA-binding MarR family transcriptional regulator